MQQHETPFEEITITPESGEPLDEGTYDAVLVGGALVTGKFGQQIRLDLELCLPDGGTRRLPLYAAWFERPRPKSKLHGILTALRGQPPAAGAPVRMGELVGAKCRVLVEHKQLGDGRTVEKLTKVYPQRAPRTAPAPAAEEGDPFA
ncbi:MAG: hypothetical protein N2651_00075 [Fimbriimonadales bacterium]|nr:hypothetical protein [Fimbriimonadales bacterium]